MAKKIQRKQKQKKISVFKRVRSFFTGEKFKYTVGLILFIFGLYLLIAFISFLFSGHADHSKMDLSFREFLTDPAVKGRNKAGKTGIYLSEAIMNRGFGISSFLLVFMLFVTAFQFFNRPLFRYWRTIVLAFVSMIWLSLFLGLTLGDVNANAFLYLGGQNGYFLAEWLSSLVGYVGTFFLLVIGLFLICLFTFDNFIPVVKRVFGRRESEISHESSSSVDQRQEVEPEESIVKVIDENDILETIFDPDSEALEMDESIDRKKIQDNVKEQLLAKHEANEDDDEDLEMTVEKVEEETDEDYEHEATEDYDPTLDLSNYQFPTIDLLDDHSSGNAEVSNDELISNKNKIVETLRHYKIEITKIRATIGPTITLYEIVPAPGIRIAKIKNLEDDIALSLAALGIRIIAPIPGRGTIGIEVPNQNPEIVSMRSIIASKKFQESTADLPVVLGKTISNETYLIDLAKMPHILVAGATGQGKSVGLNAIITSLLYKMHPAQLKFVLIDPKKVEMSLYSTIEKHFLAKLPDEEEPIITDIQKVKYTLNSLNNEMDNRYDLLKKAHARNIKEYNKKFTGRRLNPEKGHRYLPYVVVVIDEFADLIMTAGKEIELPIARIAQLARAVGIHMIIATQRPSVSIITGVIKANFPTRIAFKVASMIDSRTILDTPGANQLIGKGDMLIAAGSTISRLQCAFLDTPEVERVCEHIAKQQGYPTAFLLPEYVGEDEGSAPGAVDLANRDELFDDAARVVVVNQMGSTSMIQRKFSIGYNRAGRIMDQLEAAGVVGPSEGSKARQVLLQDEYSLEQLLNSL